MNVHFMSEGVGWGANKGKLPFCLCSAGSLIRMIIMCYSS
jgi:hypothetical protein